MITDRQEHDMLHAIGNPTFRNWRPETILKKAYRNKFVTYAPDESWEELVKKDYAGIIRQRQYDKSYIYFYFVKLEGIKALISKSKGACNEHYKNKEEK